MKTENQSSAGDSAAVVVPSNDVELQGDLIVPKRPKGVVLFAHGSGSSRHSPRNQFVAEALHAGGLATLLMDLLTPLEEDQERFTAHLRFDIDLLAGRLVDAIDWLGKRGDTRELAVGLFGASTGAGAALAAAAQRPEKVRAVVSRGGRPDLAEGVLDQVQAPTLLIVGGRDEVVIGMNQQAQRQLTAEVKLEIVPGATHLFEEPGALEEVARLAREWFEKWLA